jgi:hypothetical protein
MIYDTHSLRQPQYDRLLRGSAAPMTANNYEQTAPITKMLVGPWYLDEFGNPTREIKRLD